MIISITYAGPDQRIWNYGTQMLLKADQHKSRVATRRQADIVNIEFRAWFQGRWERREAAQIRALRHHLEHRIGSKMSKGSALVTWTTVWAAGLLNRCIIQSNARTSYERVTGHTGIQPIAARGEGVSLVYTPYRSRTFYAKRLGHGILGRRELQNFRVLGG